MDLHALSDKMPTRYDFEAPFEGKIYEREGWNHVPTEQSTLTYYTNGSAKDGMTGMGIFGCAESVEIIQFHLKASSGMPRQPLKAGH
jgi:hypothetical protein